MSVLASKTSFLVDEDNSVVLRKGDGGVQTTTMEANQVSEAPAWVFDTGTVDLTLNVLRMTPTANYSIEIWTSPNLNGSNARKVVEFPSVTKAVGKLPIDPATLFTDTAWIGVKTVVDPFPGAGQVPHINFDLRVGKARK